MLKKSNSNHKGFKYFIGDPPVTPVDLVNNPLEAAKPQKNPDDSLEIIIPHFIRFYAPTFKYYSTTKL